MQIFSVVLKGGYLMYPIIACSIIALAVFLERWYVLRIARDKVKKYVRSLRKALNQKDLAAVIEVSQKHPGPASRIILAGLRRYFNGYPREAKEGMEMVAMQEFPIFEKRLGVLTTIASISPLLGLLGTVTGMIKTFDIISIVGVGRPMEMAGGISEALITTAAGLSVAIPTVIAHHYLSGVAEETINDIEKISTEVLEIIDEETNNWEALENNSSEERGIYVPVPSSEEEAQA